MRPEATENAGEAGAYLSSVGAVGGASSARVRSVLRLDPEHDRIRDAKTAVFADKIPVGYQAPASARAGVSEAGRLACRFRYWATKALHRRFK